VKKEKENHGRTSEIYCKMEVRGKAVGNKRRENPMKIRQTKNACTNKFVQVI
jgi:hypothetical protein